MFLAFSSSWLQLLRWSLCTTSFVENCLLGVSNLFRNRLRHDSPHVMVGYPPFQSNQETNFSTTFDTLGLSLCNLILAGSIITLVDANRHVWRWRKKITAVSRKLKPRNILDHCHSFRVCSSLCNLWIIQQLQGHLWILSHNMWWTPTPTQTIRWSSC